MCMDYMWFYINCVLLLVYVNDYIRNEWKNNIKFEYLCLAFKQPYTKHGKNNCTKTCRTGFVLYPGGTGRYLLFIWNIDINFTTVDRKVVGEREVGRAFVWKRNGSLGYIFYLKSWKCVWILGTFSKLRKTAISFLMSVRLSSSHMEQHCSHWKNFREIFFLSIFLKSVRKLKVCWNLTGIMGTLHEEKCAFMIIYCSLLLKMRN